jgi:hypothetical protein
MSRSPTPKVSQTLVVACVEELWLRLTAVQVGTQTSGEHKDQQIILL